MRRLALTTLVVLSMLTAAFAIWELRSAVVLFLISLGIAAATLPFIESLVARRVPPSIAILLAYSGVVLVLGLLLFFAAGSLLVELKEATDELLLACSRLGTLWAEGNIFQRTIAERLPTAEPGADASRLGSLTVEVLGFSLDVARLVGQVVVVLVLSIFWTANRQSFERLWLSLVPAHARPAATRIWTDVRTGVGAKVGQELVQSLLAIVVLDLGFHAMGLSYATLPAFASGLLRLVPLVGQCLAVLAALLAGLSLRPMLALLAATYALAVLFLLDAVVSPRVFGTRRYSPLVVTLTAFALADTYGLGGLLVAPAVAAAIQIVAQGLFSEREVATSPHKADLDERMEALERLLAKVGETRPPELESVVRRLTDLVREAEEAATSS
ncbi:AI-2E family transporter [bacterium]|nr:AI-2E family transporter [bacterium]